MYLKLGQVQLASSRTNALRMAIAPSTANALGMAIAPSTTNALRMATASSSTANVLGMATAPSIANAPDRHKLRSREGTKEQERENNYDPTGKLTE